MTPPSHALSGFLQFKGIPEYRISKKSICFCVWTIWTILVASNKFQDFFGLSTRSQRFGCGSKPMGSHFGVGEFTTHVCTYFSGWIESDVDFDPWPFRPTSSEVSGGRLQRGPSALGSSQRLPPLRLRRGASPGSDSPICRAQVRGLQANGGVCLSLFFGWVPGVSF